MLSFGSTEKRVFSFSCNRFAYRCRRQVCNAFKACPDCVIPRKTSLHVHPLYAQFNAVSRCDKCSFVHNNPTDNKSWHCPPCKYYLCHTCMSSTMEGRRKYSIFLNYTIMITYVQSLIFYWFLSNKGYHRNIPRQQKDSKTRLFNNYSTRWLFTTSYPTRAHGIIVKHVKLVVLNEN